MATLDTALDDSRGGDADWRDLHLHVTRADERHNGVDWEGWEYSVERAGTLVAVDNVDTRDDLLAALAQWLPADFAGWYWTDYRGQRHEQTEGDDDE